MHDEAGLVLGPVWSMCSAVPGIGVTSETQLLAESLCQEGTWKQLAPPQPHTEGGSPFTYVQVNLLVKITESSCYLKQPKLVCICSHDQSGRWKQRKKNPQLHVSFRFLAKGGSS